MTCQHKMEALQAIINIQNSLKKFKRIPNCSEKNYSLRSQYYGKYKELISQCLNHVIEKIPENQEESEHLRETLIKLKHIMDAKLLLTAEDDQIKEENLHKMLLANEKIDQKISELRKEMDEGQGRFDVLLKSKLELIEKNRRDIIKLNEKTRSYLDAEIYRSETTMKEISKNNIEERNWITNTLSEAEHRLRESLAENIERERCIRKEKFDSQVQLKKWIEKYDLEVGSRTSTMRELNAIFENEQSFLGKLTDTCATQELQYTTLMQQKDREEKALQEEKMLLFMMNRSARIIQRNFRLVLAKRRLKKGKRGKGKAKKTA